MTTASFYILAILLCPLFSCCMAYLFRHQQKLSSSFSCGFMVMSLVSAFMAAAHTPFGLVAGLDHHWIALSSMTVPIDILYDPLSMVMTLLITVVGMLVHFYAKSYLDSDITQGRFMAQLSFVVFAVLLLVLSGNLLVTFIAWQMTGLGLYLLLNHYHYNRPANQSAMQKFMINRLGDLCFLIAVALVYSQWGSLDYVAILDSQHAVSPTVLLLIFVAIMTKSAQFPFHAWLPSTMETPTPVSALMHAGLINAGGFLLARLSPWYVQCPGVLDVVFVVGLVTAVFGSFLMLTKQDVKRSLAYSTVAQMGFMVMQAGLAFFSSAVFHLVVHGFYKGYLFLNAGSALTQPSIVPPVKDGHRRTLKAIVLASLFGAAVFISLNRLLSFNPVHIVLAMFVLVAIIQALYLLVRKHACVKTKSLVGAVIFTIVWLYFLTSGHFDNLLAPVLGELPLKHDLRSWKFAIVVGMVASFILLLFVPLTDHKAIRRKLFVLSLRNIWVDRVYEHLQLAFDWLTGLAKRCFEAIKSHRLMLPGLLALAVTIAYQVYVVSMPTEATSGASVSWLMGLVILSWLTNLWLVKARFKRDVISLFAANHLLLACIGILSSVPVAQLGGYVLLASSLLQITALAILTQRTSSTDSYHECHNELPINKAYTGFIMFALVGAPLSSNFIAELLIVLGISQQSLLVMLGFCLSLYLVSFNVLSFIGREVFMKTPRLRDANAGVPRQACVMLLICLVMFVGVYPQMLFNLLPPSFGV